MAVDLFGTLSKVTKIKSPIDKSTASNPKDKPKTVKPKSPINLLDFLGLAGISLAAVSLSQLPALLKKIGTGVAPFPGGNDIKTACDIAATVIEAFLIAMAIVATVMAAIKIAEKIKLAGDAIANPMSIGHTVAKVAGEIAVAVAPALAGVAIATALQVVQTSTVTMGTDGKPTGVKLGEL